MSVISINIIESEDQIVAGIPRKISIDSNIPCNIYYTLNGEDPDLFSSIYTEEIITPTYLDPLILKIFASNGISSSPVIEQKYSSNISDGVRLPRVATSNDPSSLYPNKYPYGTGDIDQNDSYISSSNIGETVNNPDLNQIPEGFNAFGEPDGYTNLPYTLENYKIKYSTTDALGQYGKGIGNLPGNLNGNDRVPTAPAIPIPEETDRYSGFFDPRAMVIFQDVSKEDPNDPPQINRQFFSLDSDRGQDGTYLYNTGADVIAPSGTFIKSYINADNKTITHYYYDNRVNRWLISKAPYNPKPEYTGNLYNNYTGRGNSIGKVYQWRMFARRVLF